MTKDEYDEIVARVNLNASLTGKGFKDEEEIKKYVDLLALEDEWKKQISTKPKIVFQDDGKEYSPEEYFSYDGFFPGYFKQKKKVLFIGRETRWICGKNFVETSMDLFENKTVGSSRFLTKAMYMIYGIKHDGKIPYGDIPYANAIAKEMVDTGNFGFAVMQLSKYSNDSDEGRLRNVGMMNRFLEDSELDKRNFFLEELSLLDPDVIITANLWDCGVKDAYLEQCFPSEKFKSWETYGNNVANYADFDLNGKTIKLINTYHFSAVKSIEEYFYNPVMHILFSEN